MEGVGDSKILVNYPGELTVTGGGFIRLANMNSRIVGYGPAAALVNLDGTIEGSGMIGNNTLGVANSGIFDANVPFADLIVDPDASGATNIGIMRASGAGRLRLLNGEFDNTSGFGFFHYTSFHYILAGMRHVPQPSDYVRNRLSPSLVQHIRQRIREVHAGVLAASIDHREFLRKQYAKTR